MKIYVFGSDFEKDDLAIIVSEQLKKDEAFSNQIEFVYESDPMSLVTEEEIIILDCCKGIDEPMIINDICMLEDRKIISLHDFDLHYVMQLFDKLELNKKFNIIALPYGSEPNNMMEITKKLILKF